MVLNVNLECSEQHLQVKCIFTIKTNHYHAVPFAAPPVRAAGHLVCEVSTYEVGSSLSTGEQHLGFPADPDWCPLRQNGRPCRCLHDHLESQRRAAEKKHNNHIAIYCQNVTNKELTETRLSVTEHHFVSSSHCLLLKGPFIYLRCCSPPTPVGLETLLKKYFISALYQNAHQYSSAQEEIPEKFSF